MIQAHEGGDLNLDPRCTQPISLYRGALGFSGARRSANSVACRVGRRQTAGRDERKGPLFQGGPFRLARRSAPAHRSSEPGIGWSLRASQPGGEIRWLLLFDGLLRGSLFLRRHGGLQLRFGFGRRFLYWHLTYPPVRSPLLDER